MYLRVSKLITCYFHVLVLFIQPLCSLPFNRVQSGVYMDEGNLFNLLFANLAIFGSVSTYSPPRPPYYAFFAFLWLFMGRITARFAHTRGWSEIKGSWWQIIKTLGMIKLHFLRSYQAQSHQRRDEYKQGTTGRHGAMNNQMNGTVPH